MTGLQEVQFAIISIHPPSAPSGLFANIVGLSYLIQGQ